MQYQYYTVCLKQSNKPKQNKNKTKTKQNKQNKTKQTNKLQHFLLTTIIESNPEIDQLMLHILKSIQGTCRLSLKMGRGNEQKPLIHCIRW